MALYKLKLRTTDDVGLGQVVNSFGATPEEALRDKLWLFASYVDEGVPMQNGGTLDIGQAVSLAVHRYPKLLNRRPLIFLEGAELESALAEGRAVNQEVERRRQERQAAQQARRAAAHEERVSAWQADGTKTSLERPALAGLEGLGDQAAPTLEPAGGQRPEL